MDSRYWDIAAKQRKGKATAAEQEELRRWLEDDPEHLVQYQAQQELWRLTERPPAPEVDEKAAWEKVKAGIARKDKRRTAQLKPMFPLALRVAASVALLVGILWLAQILFFPYFGLEVVASGNMPLSVRLPDSSQVWLNRGSKLAFDPEFGGSDRKVLLEGEAFFEVRKDPKRPFLIQTEASVTKVLGTSFNLRAYSGEPAVELVVVTGKVAFRSRESASEVLVVPGNAARLVRDGAAIDTYSHLTGNAWAWKSGRLQFEGQPLKEVLQDLERYYGVAFQLQDPGAASCRFTGSFEHAKLEGVLQVLTSTLQLEYKRKDGQAIILSGPGCE